MIRNGGGAWILGSGCALVSQSPAAYGLSVVGCLLWLAVVTYLDHGVNSWQRWGRIYYWLGSSGGPRALTIPWKVSEDVGDGNGFSRHSLHALDWIFTGHVFVFFPCHFPPMNHTC